jgi:hypothetical protein
MGAIHLTFTILELAVLHTALERYDEICAACAEDPKNKDEISKIQGEIRIVQSLLKKIKADYTANGGDASWLR